MVNLYFHPDSQDGKQVAAALRLAGITFQVIDSEEGAPPILHEIESGEQVIAVEGRTECMDAVSQIGQGKNRFNGLPEIPADLLPQSAVA